MLKNYQLFLEKNLYNINLANKSQSNYTYITNNQSRFNRLKHLIYQIEQSGSPLEGEKISEILLGATNLNVLNLSYPFVDVKVISPVRGVTQMGELISVKTTKDMHNLKDAVTYVNGFKISQLIQFAISKINLKIYKSEIFKDRFAIKLSSITSYYQKTITELFSSDSTIYTYAFVNTIVILKFIKDYLNYLTGVENIIEKNRSKLYSIMRVCITSFIDKKFGTNYTDRLSSKLDDMKKSVQNFISSSHAKYDFTSDYINYGEALPKEIQDLKISYCIIYFNDSDTGVVLNLQKTQAISFGELFNNSMKIWIKKGYHLSEGKKNYYLKYEDVVQAFTPTGITLSDDDVFSTHIQVTIDSDWEYQERTQKVKELYVKVIDNIKGIENDDAQKKILKLLNKYLKKINSSGTATRDRYIQKFSEIFDKT